MVNSHIIRSRYMTKIREKKFFDDEKNLNIHCTSQNLKENKVDNRSVQKRYFSFDKYVIGKYIT
jgi:hypothetical protein